MRPPSWMTIYGPYATEDQTKARIDFKINWRSFELWRELWAMYTPRRKWLKPVLFAFAYVRLALLRPSRKGGREL